MAKENKTNAMRFLDKAGIAYETTVYECGEFIDGLTVANALGQDPSRTFKTLVARGKSGAYFCFLLPVGEELDLKKAAESVGEKSVSLLHVKEIAAVTGYVRGGCTPIGMKKQFPTVIHSSARELSEFFISGGRIGVQIELSPRELVRAIGGKFADLVAARGSLRE